MENPETWGEAEKIVRRVLDEHDEHHRQVAQGKAEPICGLSLERKITEALREASLLSHEDPYFSCRWCHPDLQA